MAHAQRCLIDLREERDMIMTFDFNVDLWHWLLTFTH